MPVIEWFAEEGDPVSLVPLLCDEETRCSVLYVIAELPTGRVSAPLREAIQLILPQTTEGSQERGWAEDVLSPDVGDDPR